MKNLMIAVCSLAVLAVFGLAEVNAQTFFGADAGEDGTRGTFLGERAGESNQNNSGTTDGNDNTFVGFEAGSLNTTGRGHTYVGSQAGNIADGGVNNTALGANAGRNLTDASYSTFLGHSAGRFNTTGNANTLIGSYAGYRGTTGQDNVIIGSSAGFEITSGRNNVYIGRLAGQDNQTGRDNVFIGYRAGFNETNVSDRLLISNNDTRNLIEGDFATNQVAIGADPNNLGTNNSSFATGFTLSVHGAAIAEELKIRTIPTWPDYVFTPEHQLKSLEEVEQHIIDHGHLPNMAPAQEIEKEGYYIGQMDVKLLENIEELMLHVIELNKKVKSLEAELEEERD